VSLAVPLKVSGTLSSPRVAPTTAAIAKSVAGLAVTGLTPMGLIAALANKGSGEQNPCVAALDRAAPQPGSAPANTKGAPKNAPADQQQPANSNNPLDALRGLFGGKK
jgi:hypothetical protein